MLEFFGPTPALSRNVELHAREFHDHLLLFEIEPRKLCLLSLCRQLVLAVRGISKRGSNQPSVLGDVANRDGVPVDRDLILIPQQIEHDVFHARRNDPFDLRLRPGDDLVRQQQRADAQHRSQQQRRSQQRHDTDPRRLGRRDLLIARHPAIDDTHAQQQRRRNRVRHQAGNDVGHHLQNLQRSETSLSDLLKHSEEAQQHRQHAEHKHEHAQQLAQDITLQQPHRSL